MLRDLAKKIGLIRYLVRRYRARARLPKIRNLCGKDRERWKEISSTRTNGTRVLFATSAGGNMAAIALETILVLALAIRHAKVTILLCDGVLPACLLCTLDTYRNERRFAAVGPEKSDCEDCFSLAYRLYEKLGIQVIRYSDYIDQRQISKLEQISDGSSVDEIKRYEQDGMSIGEHALAGALRFYAKAMLNDPHSETVLRRYFKASLITAHVMRRVLSERQFDCAVFDHGIYVPNGVIGEVARHHGLRVVNWHVAYRKRCFIFSHQETYHHTLMQESARNWENMPWTENMEKELMDYLISRWWGDNDWITFSRNPRIDASTIANEVNIDLSKTTIGMLTNVMWDAQLHYPANAFDSMLEWVLETIEYFSKRRDLQLLIRVHPAEVSGTLPSRQPMVQEIHKVFPKLPGNVFVVPPTSVLSTYALMQKCNAVIIYGTKTGVELTSMGIPTIVAGEAWIRNKGITMDASSKQEYIHLLEKLPLQCRMSEAAVQRARKYAYHFFFRRMIPLNCVEATATSPPFKAKITTVESLYPGRDPGLDVICDGVLNGTEFIYRAEEALNGHATRTSVAQ